MLRISILFFTFVLLIHGGFETSQTAAALPPLYVTLHNTLVSWAPETGAAIVSNWPYNDQPVGSADGQHIAFINPLFDRVHVMMYYNGQVTPIFDDSVVPPMHEGQPYVSDGLTWGPIKWSIRSGPKP